MTRWDLASRREVPAHVRMAAAIGVARAAELSKNVPESELRNPAGELGVAAAASSERGASVGHVGSRRAREAFASR